MSITSFAVRALFKYGDDKRDAGLRTPSDIQRFNDIQYGPFRQSNVLDVYRPWEADGKIPVIISIHGGGWVYGDKDRYQYYCMSLAQHGFAVINFTYRLAPKYKFPAGLEDTNNVVRWMLKNAEQYGFDTAKVFFVGDSAGAHMLGLYSCICTNPEYAGMIGITAPRGFVPTAVALNCGVYHVEKRKKKGLTDRLMADLMPHKGTEEELKKVCVIPYVNGKFPPAFVMTAEGDFLKDQAEPMVETIKACGGKAEYHYYGDEDHVLGHVFHCNMKSEDAKQCNKDECDFFKTFLD